MESLGDVRGKTILLLAMAALTRSSIFCSSVRTSYSRSLAPSGAGCARDLPTVRALAEYQSMIEFHPWMRMRLPLADASVDVIYGTKCVKFFDDKALFFSESHVA